MLTSRRTTAPWSRRLAAAVLVLGAPALTSCGFDYATDAIYTPAPGTNDRQGQVDVLNAAVVASENGKSVFLATLSNNSTKESDALTKLEGEGITATTRGNLELRPGGFNNLAESGGIQLSGGDIKPGGYVELTLTFTNAEPVTMDVPVHAPVDQWAEFGTPSQESGGHGSESHGTGGSESH